MWSLESSNKDQKCGMCKRFAYKNTHSEGQTHKCMYNMNYAKKLGKQCDTFYIKLTVYGPHTF